MRIIITAGPGAKSGIFKTTVAIEGVEPFGKAHHFTDTIAAEGYKDELQQQYGPGLEVVRRTR